MTQTETMQQQDQWLGTREAAVLVGATWETFRHCHRDWGVPSYKVGGRYRFIEGEVREWLQSRKEPSA